MSNTVKLTMTADQRDVVKAFQNINSQLGRTEARLNALGLTGKKAGKDTEVAMGKAGDKMVRAGQSGLSTAMKMTGAFIGTTAVLRGMGAVLSSVRAEFQAMEAARGAAADTQRTVAEAQRASAFNFGTADAAKMDAAVKSISADTGAGAADLYNALSAAASSRGELTIDDAIASVRTAARVNPYSGDAIQTIATAILSQQQAGGGQAEDIAGWQLRLKQKAKVVTDESFAQYISPGVAQLKNMGLSDQEAGALLAYNTHAMGDKEGRLSATQSISFVKQIQGVMKGVAPDATFTEQLKMLSESPGLRGKFLGAFDKDFAGVDEKTRKKILAGEVDGASMSLTGEAKGFAGAIRLINGDGQGQFNQIQGELGAVQGSQQFFQSELTAVNAMDRQRQGNQRNNVQAAGQGAELANIGANAAIANQEYLKAINNQATLSERVALRLMDPAMAMSAATPDAFDDIALKSKVLGDLAGAKRGRGEIDQADQLQRVADSLEALAKETKRLEASMAVNNAITKANTLATEQAKNNIRNAAGNPTSGQQRGE